MNIGILEHNDFSTQVINALSLYGHVHLYKKHESVEDFLRNKHILFVRLGYQLDRALLLNATELKYICSPTTGLNHIDVHFCKTHGIRIISLKGEAKFLQNIRATPEHTFGLLLSLLRHYNHSMMTPASKADRERYKGHELFQKTVGIIGYGRVGKILATYLLAFGCKVLVYDIMDDALPENIVQSASLKKLINSSEIIFLCANYTEANNHMIDKTMLILMKDKYFINTARGELVDEEFMLELIEKNYFKGVAIDVFQNESKQNNRLTKILELTRINNFIFTPHIAGATYESMWKTERFIFQKLEPFISVNI